MSAALAKLHVSLLPHQREVFRWPMTVHHVVYPKGRRAGGTAGAQRTALRWAYRSPLGRPLRQLWVDITHRNISRYLNRYFLTSLRALRDGKDYTLNRAEMTFTFPGGAILDFGSVEQGHKIEGWGYDVVWINEAGHVLKDEEFYWQTLVPMTIERQGARVFYVGAPKGRAGLFERFFLKGSLGAAEHDPDFVSYRHTSFDNPLLNHAAIERYVREMPPWLYQQEIMAEFVAPAEARFQREWFPLVETYPAVACQHVRYWDLAASKVRQRNGVAVSDPDATSGCLSAFYPQDRLEFIVDVRRFRDGPAGVLKAIEECARRDPPGTVVVIEQEPGASGIIAIHGVRERIAALGVLVVADLPTGPKEARSAPLAAWAEAGRAKVLRAAWNGEFFRELEAFPKGRHDDMVDSASGAHGYLLRAGILGASVQPWATQRDTDWGDN